MVYDRLKLKKNNIFSVRQTRLHAARCDSRQPLSLYRLSETSKNCVGFIYFGPPCIQADTACNNSLTVLIPDVI